MSVADRLYKALKAAHITQWCGLDCPTCQLLREAEALYGRDSD